MTLLFKWINRQIILSLVLIGMSVSTIFMPWCTCLWQLYLCMFIYAFGWGSWGGCANVILIEMWKHGSPSMLQLAQFMWSLGTILGPLLVESYVIGVEICPGVRPELCDTVFNTTTNTTVYVANSNCTEECLQYDRRPVMKIPFLIGGLIQMIGKNFFFKY